MRCRIYVTVQCPSVCRFHRSVAAVACLGFAAGRPAGKRYPSTAGADAQQQRRRRGMTLSSKYGQCHVYSRRRRLNTDLFALVLFVFVPRDRLTRLSTSLSVQDSLSWTANTQQLSELWRRNFCSRGTSPVEWNSLPAQLRNPDITYGQFRGQLKGHLFREAWTRRSVTSDMRRHRKTLTYLLIYLSHRIHTQTCVALRRSRLCWLT